MIEIREILRLWLQGRGLREVARLSGTDRKTVRRYVDRARACGVDRDGEACQLTDELLAAVIGGVRPSRPNGKSQAWETIGAQAEQIKAWLDQDLTLTKVHTLLGRRGVLVSYRTLHRYAVTELEFGQRQTTVRVADCEPGAEVQVDFGRLGLLTDAADGRRRVVHGLIFTAVYSRHTFVWPTYRQTLNDVIAGFEAAWAFFGGVFAVVIPDNMKAIVDRADATDPKLNDAFREYAQARGFAVDPARVRSPRDKPRVERSVSYVRSNFFAGEDFRDLDDCRARAAHWCGEVAGMRVHGTTRLHPAEVFATVTPAVPQFNARADNGINYRVLWQANTPNGISGATITQGQQSTGKIYFDVTGPPPTTVALNNGMEDLLIWDPPAAAIRRISPRARSSSATTG